MSKAVYCKCENTYSIDCRYGKNKRCKTPEYWKQGIGSIHQSNGVSDVINNDSPRSISNQRSGLWD